MERSTSTTRSARRSGPRRAADGTTTGRAANGHVPAVTTGRPRDPRIDRAVFDATAALLAEVGYNGLSLEAVARRAGVGRPSLYRRWSSKAALVVDALGAIAGTDPAPDTGSLRGDLTALTVAMAALYDTPLARQVVPGLLGDLARQPDLADRFRTDYIEPRRTSTKHALSRAVARGEIPPVTDPEQVCDLLAGPLLLRAFVLDRRTSETEATALVDAVLATVGHDAGTATRRPSPPAPRHPTRGPRR